MADFTHENLSGARFEDVYLTGADFHGVDLTGVILNGEWQHRRYAERDLDALERRLG